MARSVHEDTIMKSELRTRRSGALISRVLCLGAALSFAAPGSAGARDVPEGSDRGAREVPRPLSGLDLRGRGIEDRAPIRSKEENEGEFLAYCDALVTASYMEPARLAAQARRDLTFAHLFEQPAAYRGEVVHFDGSLARLRRFEAPQFTWGQGVRELYEGWVFDARTYGANAVCVVFTRLPPRLTVGERMDRPVAVDGYFFKRYRYRAGDGWRDAPLLIAGTVTLRDSPSARPAQNLPAAMLWSSVGLIGAIAVLVGGFAWWYRRGDRNTRHRLQTRHLPETGSDMSPAAVLSGVNDETGPLTRERKDAAAEPSPTR